MWTDLSNNSELFQSLNRTVSVWPTKLGGDIPDTLVPWLAFDHSSHPTTRFWNHFQAKYMDNIYSPNLALIRALLPGFCQDPHSSGHPVCIPNSTPAQHWASNTGSFVCLVCPPHPQTITWGFTVYTLENMGWGWQLHQTTKWPENWDAPGCPRMLRVLWLRVGVSPAPGGSLGAGTDFGVSAISGSESVRPTHMLWGGLRGNSLERPARAHHHQRVVLPSYFPGPDRCPVPAPPCHSKAGWRTGGTKSGGDQGRGTGRLCSQRDGVPTAGPQDPGRTPHLKTLWTPTPAPLDRFPGPHRLPRPQTRTSDPGPGPLGPRSPAGTPEPPHPWPPTWPASHTPRTPSLHPRPPEPRTPEPALPAQEPPASPGGGPRTHPVEAAAGPARATASAPFRAQLRGRGPATRACALPAAQRPPRSP